MSGERCKKWMWQESHCSICLDLFRDPVMLDCGHNFCTSCITRCWKESDMTVCPQCRGKIQIKRLRPNRQLASMVEVTRGLSDPRPGEEPELDRKEQISWYIEVMRKKKDKILLLKVESERESQNLQKQMETEKERTAAAFRDQHQFLEEQEKFLLSQMEEVEKEIERRRDEQLARLSEELSSFESLIQELEEKQKQSAKELQEDLGNIFERCPKEMIENPVAFPASLKWRIHDFGDINPFLEAIMKQFKDSLRSGLPLQEVDLTLDANTAQPQLILSEDCKSLKWGSKNQNLPDSPQRFDHQNLVLGHEGFTSGRYFWEVVVRRGNVWAVGVARKSVRRKGWFPLKPQEGIWAVERCSGKIHICGTPAHRFLPLKEEPKRIRVTVNYAAGRVAFFDGDTTAQLHTFTGASFHGETILPCIGLRESGHICL